MRGWIGRRLSRDFSTLFCCCCCRRCCCSCCVCCSPWDRTSLFGGLEGAASSAVLCSAASALVMIKTQGKAMGCQAHELPFHAQEARTSSQPRSSAGILCLLWWSWNTHTYPHTHTHTPVEECQGGQVCSSTVAHATDVRGVATVARLCVVQRPIERLRCLLHHLEKQHSNRPSAAGYETHSRRMNRQKCSGLQHQLNGRSKGKVRFQGCIRRTRAA